LLTLPASSATGVAVSLQQGHFRDLTGIQNFFRDRRLVIHRAKNNTRGRGGILTAVTNTPLRRDARLIQWLLPAGGVTVGILLLAGPLLATLARSLLVWTDGQASLSLANFSALVNSSHFSEAVINTLICGVGATIASCVLGFYLAWIVARTNVPGRGWLEILNLIPFFLSPYVGAVSWIYLAAPHSGLLQHFFQSQFGLSLEFLNIYSLGGVIFVLALFYTPYIYLFLLAPLRQMDGALEDAARVHGAGFGYTLRHITVPLVMPAMLSGALIVFVTSAGLFDVPLALAAPKGIHTIPTEIFSYVQYPADFGAASAIGVMVVIVTVVLTLFHHRYIGRRRYETVSGKGYRPRLINLRPWALTGVLILEIVYLGGAVLLPTVALILVALSSIWTGQFNPQFATLQNFHYVSFEYSLTRGAIGNSLILAIVGATLSVGIALFQAYYLNRGRRRGRGFIDAVLSLPLGIPSIILGLGFLILGIRTPLYSTLTIILIAYIARFFPFAMRNISAMFLAINPELEQSARASGASWWQTMRFVLLPLLRPALISAWLMLFVIFVRELGATILLYAQGTETISVALVLLSERNFGYVAALALIQLCLLLAAFVLLRVARTSIVEI
jgi:iron(III) transport system permease protein